MSPNSGRKVRYDYLVDGTTRKLCQCTWKWTNHFFPRSESSCNSIPFVQNVSKFALYSVFGYAVIILVNLIPFHSWDIISWTLLQCLFFPDALPYFSYVTIWYSDAISNEISANVTYIIIDNPSQPWAATRAEIRLQAFFSASTCSMSASRLLRALSL